MSRRFIFVVTCSEPGDEVQCAFNLGVLLLKDDARSFSLRMLYYMMLLVQQMIYRGDLCVCTLLICRCSVSDAELYLYSVAAAADIVFHFRPACWQRAEHPLARSFLPPFSASPLLTHLFSLLTRWHTHAHASP